MAVRDKAEEGGSDVGTMDSEGNHWGAETGDGSTELARHWGKPKVPTFRCPAGRWWHKTEALEGSQVRNLTCLFYKSIWFLPPERTEMQCLSNYDRCAYFGAYPYIVSGRKNPGHALNILNF